MHGYSGRILHIDLRQGEVKIDTFDEAFAQTYLGGNGFASRLLHDRLAPGIDPVAPENMIVFAVGPTTDTLVPGATRCCAATKSPLAGLFFDSTFGGMFAAVQKRAGFEAVSIVGQSDTLMYVLIHEDGAELNLQATCGGSTREPPISQSSNARMPVRKCCRSDLLGKTACVMPAPYLPGKKSRDGVAAGSGLSWARHI